MAYAGRRHPHQDLSGLWRLYLDVVDLQFVSRFKEDRRL
jgi:hypothetical protein